MQADSSGQQGTKPHNPDSVYLRAADKDGPAFRIAGTIQDYTGEKLSITLSTGRVSEYPAERVLELRYPQSAAHARADALYDAGRHADAALLYADALAPQVEKRKWVSRIILAKHVVCLKNTGQFGLAVEAFLNLLEQDPATPDFHVIPLVVVPKSPDTSMVQMALRLQKSTSEVEVVTQASKLIAASILLHGVKRAESAALLKSLASSTDSRIKFLAAVLAHAGNAGRMTANDLDRLQTQIEDAPWRLRGPAYFVLGRELAAVDRHEEALLALLRLPTVYPHESQLAARSLLESGRLLDKLDRPNEARQLWREVITQHAGDDSALEARALLDAPSQRHAE